MYLDLSSNRLAHVDEIACANNLRVLLLAHNQVGCLVTKISRLDPLKTLLSLVELDLQSNNLAESSALDILRHCKQLSVLNVSGNEL